MPCTSRWRVGIWPGPVGKRERASKRARQAHDNQAGDAANRHEHVPRREHLDERQGRRVCRARWHQPGGRHPGGAADSQANGVDGGQQVGRASIGGTYHAGLWNGTAASWRDLNPAVASFSYAYAVGDGQEAGYVGLGSTPHASLWSGTASSWVDLNPAEANFSYAYSVSGGQQVGYVYTSGTIHASLWSGTAASWVDLNPAGADYSAAYGVDGGQQVGTITAGGTERASLWTGSGASWVDLSPTGATDSQALGAHGGQQVGYATLGGINRAGLWSGTAASWVDLHTFLPTGYNTSFAFGICHETGATYVVGETYNSSLARYEAIMWVLPAHVPPASFSVFRGGLESGNLSSLLDSDDDYLEVRNGITAQRTESPIMLRVSGQSPVQSPATFQFVVENKVSIRGLNQLIDLYDYTQGRFVNADTRAASTNDAVVTVTGSAANVEAGTRNIQSQLQIRPAGPLFTNTWRGYVDQTVWLIG